ncbi:MAG: MFS transporter [Chloroflexota bacterium]|nr:MFS transporter [Chloroflexota bacterium]
MIYLEKLDSVTMKFKFKLFIFFQYFSIGILGPYMVMFLSEKDFSGAQIGVLLGVMPIASLVFQPLWGYLSDVINNRRYLLMISSFGVALASLGLVFFDSFVPMLLNGILFSAMIAPISAISTAIILDYLEEMGKKEEFSLIRLWGSLGFAVSSIGMAGLFLDQVLVYFGWFSAGIYLILGGISLFLPEREKPFVYSGFKGIGVVIKNTKFLIFLIASVFIGATMGICSNFQTLSLQSLGASAWLIGVIISIQALLEIPMMLVVPSLLKRLSMRCLILIGALMLPVRWLLYIFIKNPVWVIPTQIFNSIATISFLVVAIAFIDKLISPKWRATGQALYSTALWGTGGGLGIFLAGNLIERFNIWAIWPFNLVLGLIGLVLVIVALSGIGDAQGSLVKDQ